MELGLIGIAKEGRIVTSLKLAFFWITKAHKGELDGHIRVGTTEC